MMRYVAIAIVAGLSFVGATARAEQKPPALVIRLSQPDEQARRVIALFRNARAPHPAAALAGWKYATGGSLGKPMEALITAFNPGMIRELRSMEDAECVIRFDNATTTPRWRLILPRDDGSLAAALPALGLTDGKVEPSIGTTPVLRLGPPGAPLGAFGKGWTVVASDAAQLEAALDDRADPVLRSKATQPGWEITVDPAGLRDLSRIEARRIAAWLDSLGATRATCHMCMDEHDGLSVRITTALDASGARLPALDPAWLDPIPATGVIGAFAIALDPQAKSLDALFATLDRVEKADPDRAAIAPIRTRLNLLAAAAKVFPDVDLWPHLRGIVGAVMAGEPGMPSGLIVLQSDSPEAAKRIATSVVPHLVAGLQPKRVIGTKAVGTAIFVGIGPGALEAALDAAAHPTRSASATIRANWASTPPHRCGAFWPGRLPGVDAALAHALDAAPPALWTGRAHGASLEDTIHWISLDGIVKRWIEALPFKPPVAR
jgi:hypothetical protein